MALGRWSVYGFLYNVLVLATAGAGFKSAINSLS